MRRRSQQPDPKSVNAQKKAAKKAAKKAQKGAMKQQPQQPGDETAAAGGGGAGGSSPAGISSPKKQKKPGSDGGAAATGAASSSSSTATPSPPGTVAATFPIDAKALTMPGSAGIALQPLQVAINPNHPLIERPVVAMSVAVLTNTVVDLDIVSDHRRPHTALGVSSGDGSSQKNGTTTTVVGDLAMARCLLRRAAPGNGVASKLAPDSGSSSSAVVDSWVDYAQSLMRLSEEQRLNAITLSLEHALGGGFGGRKKNVVQQTYLVGEAMTLADLSVFAAAGFPTQVADRTRVLDKIPKQATAVRRWVQMMASNTALHEATQLCVGVANNLEAVFDETNTLEPLVSGMNTLEGAVPGRVVTRFPPEPSGYLHIGHAKAALLNDYYARRYKGRLLLRFDDTNPSKEKEEFQDAIVVDLATLGIKPDSLSFTSDYFDVIAGYARGMIENGLAFMDDTPQEQMKAERLERKESKHRNQTPEEALKYFELMCSGSQEGAAWCLRAKIDMASDNGTMRDPVLFRQNLTPHHRSGTKYKAYPTYDLACPIVDSIEGVTHALRTTEYNDRDEQYQWVLVALGLRRVRIHAFSRVNFVNTVLSKRKLTWFVENGYVTGWDDPRFPTVRGVVRRGINITALRNFIYSQGASRRVVNLEWMVFWSENKREIDKAAKRFMAIDKENNVRLTLVGAPKESDFAYIKTSFHPKDPGLGTRAIRIANEVLLEKVDIEGIEVGEEIVLLRWGVVKISKIDGGNLVGEYVPNGDVKAAKRKLSWIASVANNTPVVITEFDNLVSKDKLDEDDNFEDFSEFLVCHLLRLRRSTSLSVL